MNKIKKYILFFILSLLPIIFLKNNYKEANITREDILIQNETSSGISVEEETIIKDGEPFLIKGGIFTFTLTTEKQLKNCNHKICDRHKEVRDSYFKRGQYQNSPGILEKSISNWNLNTVRFNVNQAALANYKENPYYDPDYVNELKEIVAIARAKNMVVMVALFDGRNKNFPQKILEQNPKNPMDTATTKYAAKKLAQLFKNDNLVAIELLNEPYSPYKDLDKAWSVWRDGGEGAGKFPHLTFVGVNPIIKAIRDEGAKNLIILQSLTMSFKKFPGGVEDPLNKLVYSEHPIFSKGEDDLRWEESFGKHAESYPTIITAWNASTKIGTWCKKGGVGKPKEFLEYLKNRNIGLVGFSLDTNRSMVKNWKTGEPTVMAESCDSFGNAGKLIMNHFK